MAHESRSNDSIDAEVTERLAFTGPLPGSQGYPSNKSHKYWSKPTGGQKVDDWLKAVPSLQSKEPLPKLVEMLSEAGSQGMELGAIARTLGTSDIRIDLLKLKAYLTCFPSRIVVAPKVKGFAGGEGGGGPTKKVDQVWLIEPGA